MSLNLSDEEIHGLIAYARDKFADERYPFAPTLRTVRGALAKLDPKAKPETLPARKPYVPSLCRPRRTSGGAKWGGCFPACGYGKRGASLCSVSCTSRK